ncbi:MAG TPA: phosphate signaling complex protein PhoU [Polyangiaceae bacterium]|nr:phosphate signaling complex protein PhoU [Polyangiaceae bacterium]
MANTGNKGPAPGAPGAQAWSPSSMQMARHTDREYENELATLRDRVLLMGARVEEMMSCSLRAFTERNLTLASTMIAADRQIDELELSIDELSLKILARRQPVASDLRFVTTTLKLVTDLERIGDLCVNVCERVLELGNEATETKQHDPISRIAEIAQGMLHDALDAFVAGDAVKAEQVMTRDDVVDAYYAQLFPELVARMMGDPGVVFRCTRLLSLGKYVERIADHATNIAEMVVFMVRGQDVRHMGVPQLDS